MRVRLVASDLDGTLVRTDGSISERTQRALNAVEDAGIELVLVTGRPARWMAPVVEATGHRGIAICANGAIIYDLHREAVLEATIIDAATAVEAVRRIREAVPGVAFAVERPAHSLATADHAGSGSLRAVATASDPITTEYAREESYVTQIMVADGYEVGPAESLLARGAVKLLVQHTTILSDELAELANQAAGHLVAITHSNPTESLLEVSALGISKAATLERFAADKGIAAAEVIAFGDNPNDVEMLAWAGTSYAVANAHPAAKAVATHTTTSNDDDGVARVLETLI